MSSVRHALIVGSAAAALAVAGATTATASSSVKVRASTARVPVRCGLPTGCRTRVQLTVVERTRHGRIVSVSARGAAGKPGRKRATVGTTTTTLAPQGRKTLRVPLNAHGRRLRRSVRSFAAAVRITNVALPAPAPTPAPVPVPTPTPPVVQTCPDPPPMWSHPPLPAAGPGPTSLIGGMYLVGGPPPPFCQTELRPWQGGTVYVVDASGAAIASQTVANDETFSIPVPSGSYTLTTDPTRPYGFCQSAPVTASAGQVTPVVLACGVP